MHTHHGATFLLNAQSRNLKNAQNLPEILFLECVRTNNVRVAQHQIYHSKGLAKAYHVSKFEQNRTRFDRCSLKTRKQLFLAPTAKILVRGAIFRQNPHY